MEKYIFIILTWDGCHHCIDFKVNKKYDNMSGLEKTSNLISSLNNVNIVQSNKPKYSTSNTEFYDIIKGEIWYPSFYLFTESEWNKAVSGIPPSGLVLGGKVVNGVINRDGSKRSINPSAIFEWVKQNTQNTQNGSYNHLSYERRLNDLWSS